MTGVILLHGLVRTSLSMRPLAVCLRQRGFAVVNVGYPSRQHTVETLAHAVIPPAIAELRRQGVGTIHFVTHSMGGILLRSFLATQFLPELGRVVMLSPPNQGSELVDYFRRFWWFRWFFGPAGCQLGTTVTDLPRRLGPLIGTVGIITGNHPASRLFSRFFPGPNDGKVSVASAHAEGLADFQIMPYGHSFIMYHRPVQEQVDFFLEQGRFRR